MRNSIMKKIYAATAITAMAASLMILPAHAADNTSAASTQLSLYVPADPTYTITIPESVAISSTENTQVPITASDVTNLPDNKKISVTYASGSGVMGRLYLEGSDPTDGSDHVMMLMIQGTDGEFKMGALENQTKGMELASFTDNGTSNFVMYPCSFDYPNGTGNLQIQKGTRYSASMTYGIELADK